MKARVIVNRGGGTLAGGARAIEERLRAAFAKEGIEADLRIVAPEQIASAFEEAARAEDVEIVVAGGGDGTVSTAAACLAGTGRPLGLIPLGTLNHLARDAGIPAQIEEAVAAVAHGTVRRIDLGEVNGRLFVNNSAIGLYPHIVRDREAQQESLGRGKRRAMLVASVRALRRFGRHRLIIRTECLAAPVRTPLLLVGNNRYETSLLSFGRRQALDEGELSLYAPLVRSRLHFLGLGLRGLIGLTRQRDFLSLTGIDEAIVESSRPVLSISLDGETVRLETPLRYSIRRQALALVVPKGHDEP